ncbi:hypothetical protein [Streptomyces afghaniensis]|nr:hypothetical protein [Streptomyces afghaniensis]
MVPDARVVYADNRPPRPTSTPSA